MASQSDVAVVEVGEEKIEGGVKVLVKKFGVGSDVTGKFKVSAYASVEPFQDLELVLPHTQNEFNLEALGEVLSGLVRAVRIVVKHEAIELEKSFYEETV